MNIKITDIKTDDPELAELLATLSKPTYPLQEVIKGGPAGTTKVYEEMASGRLVANYCGSRRFVFAADYARWLLLLKRESEARISKSVRNVSKLAAQGVRA